VHDTDVYFEHYLQFHRYKHRREERSITLPKGGALKERRFTFASTSDDYKQGCVRTLRLIRGDASQADAIIGEGQCHLIVCDLPYGVQHAPRSGPGTGTMDQLLRGTLPACCRAIRRGGAMALAFNTYTLPRGELTERLRDAGFTPLTEPPFDDFSHWVEQAVNRDMIVAVKTR